MPAQTRQAKRKAIGYECCCYDKHATSVDCEMQEHILTHQNITRCAVVGSPFVVLEVGKNKVQISAHRDLLMLHSGYFRALFAKAESAARGSEARDGGEGAKSMNSSVSRDNFAQFMNGGFGQGQGIMAAATIKEEPRDNILNTPPSTGTTIANNSKESSKATSPGSIENSEKAMVSNIFTLEDINPIHFADFISWVYTAEHTGHLGSDFEDEGEAKWQLGHVLQSPGFQNFAMDLLRNVAKERYNEDGFWPSIAEATYIYNACPPNSRIRKFAAHCLACHSPLGEEDEDSAGFGEWKQLLSNLPDLSFEVVRAAGRRWGKTMAWDGEYRAGYLVREEGLEELWDELILSRRSAEVVRKMGEKREGPRDILERLHLDRNED